MKKILFGLMAAACFSSASAQELNCNLALRDWDAYVPSLCNKSDNGAQYFIYPDYESIAPFTISNPHVIVVHDKGVQTWDEAQKVCDKHEESGYSEDGHPWIYTYEKDFQSACKDVEQHFKDEEEARRRAKDRKDLGDLNDFLAGSAGK